MKAKEIQKPPVLTYEQAKAIKDIVERAHKKEKGYDKMGLNWAYTDEDRRIIRAKTERALQEAQRDDTFRETLKIVESEGWWDTGEIPVGRPVFIIDSNRFEALQKAGEK